MRLALDSSIFIYAMKQEDSWGRLAQNLLRQIDGGHLSGIASTLCLAEVLIKPQAESVESGLAAQIFLEGISHLDFVATSEEIAIRSTLLRAQFGSKLKLIDALHVATALEAHADAFITNDHDVAKLKIPGLKIKLLDQPPS